jgi:TonB-linked SusC/RagA family outer membrane protein
MLRVRQFLVALAATALCAAPLAAQTGTISGRVVNANTRQALELVLVSAADRTARTDADGRFSITVPAGTYTVRAIYLGYREATQTVTVVAGVTANVGIDMAPVAVRLEAVVVTSYGDEQASRDVTGVIQSVSADEFNPGRVISAEELIQAKVPGVRVIDSGEPGGGISIRIRGGTSITSSNEPLFVIDGMPLAVGGGISAGRNPLNFLNPEDIESITVLKDASSTAIYGSQGANGVVLIETREGRRAIGGTGSRLTYTGTVSGSTVTGGPEVLTADQFRTAVAQYAPSASSLLGSANTNWRDLVVRTGVGQEHTLAFAGATDDFDYRLSLGYLKQQGAVRGSDTERATVGLGFSHRFFNDRARVTANLRGSRMDDEFSPGGVIGGATIFQPTEAVLDPASPYGGYFEWYDYALAANNPIAELELAQDKGTTYRSVGSVEGEVDIPFIQGLSASVRFGFDATKTEREAFRPSYLRGEAETGLPGFVSRSNNTQSNVLFDAFVHYDRNLQSLNTDVNFTAGYSYGTSNSTYPYFEARGLSFDLLGTAGIPASDEQRLSMWVDESRLVSFFGRAHFSMADKYLLTLSVRRDGSSKFGPDEQWGTFPSAALGWRLSSESFLRDVTWLSELKLRLSWGLNGNQAFPNYQQFPAYTIGEPTAQYLFGNEFVTTIRPGAADRGIKWEQTTSYNVGLDFGFSDDRFTGTIDYYYKKTNDLIFRVPVAAGTFTSNFITTNIGSLKNRGLEFGLSAVLAEGRGGGFSWTADFNAATNANEIVQINPFSSGEVILTGGIGGAVGNYIQVLQAGQPNNSFYVYEHIRGASGMPIWTDTDGNGTIDENDIYVDQNDDGIVNQDDRVPFKSPDPTWSFGHTSRMGWGNFDASFTMRAYLGNYVYNNVASNYGHYRALTYSGIPNNLEVSVLETGFEREQYFSDYYIEDASLLRLDNITVGYTFSLGSGQQMRIFGVVQNAFTLTGYSGVDPLAGVNGIDNNLYPRTRTFTAGANVRF